MNGVCYGQVGSGDLGIELPSLYFVYFFNLVLLHYLRQEITTAAVKCEKAKGETNPKRKMGKESKQRQKSPLLGLHGPGWRMKLGYKSSATTTLWGEVREGSRTAIKAIKKRLRSLVVEGERPINQ